MQSRVLIVCMILGFTSNCITLILVCCFLFHKKGEIYGIVFVSVCVCARALALMYAYMCYSAVFLSL
jgi:hypothetical protein